MSIYRKCAGGTWYYDIGVNGRRLRGSTGTADETEARLFEQGLAFAVRKKTPRDRFMKLVDFLFPEDVPPDIPLAACAAECARIQTNAGRPPTKTNVRDRRSAVGKLIAWAERKRPDVSGVRQVDRTAAQAFAASLRHDGLSDKSRANIVNALGAMWNILKREHDGIENPWPLARPMSCQSGRREAFTPETARRIIAEADRTGHGWGIACRIAAATGLRYGDVADLTFGDVRDGAIRATPVKTKRFGIKVVLPLPREILDAIGEGPPAAYILPEHHRRHAAGKAFDPPFSGILRRVGLDTQSHTFHSWRHYFRTQLAAAGVGEDTAMRLGGWTQRDTAARYDHDDHRAESADAIARAWALTGGAALEHVEDAGDDVGEHRPADQPDDALHARDAVLDALHARE